MYYQFSDLAVFLLVFRYWMVGLRKGNSVLEIAASGGKALARFVALNKVIVN